MNDDIQCFNINNYDSLMEDLSRNKSVKINLTTDTN